MTWVKIDDQFPDHPKMLRIPVEAKPEAIALALLGLCYSNRYLTDGKLEANVVKQLNSAQNGFTGAHNLPSILVQAGLWERDENGYIIHDYLEYNPSKKQVLALRRKRQASGKQGGLRSGQARRKQVARPLLNPRPVPSPSPPDPPVKNNTPLAPTGDNGLPEWFRATLESSQHFTPLISGHDKFWLAMTAAYDPYEWLKWDEQVQKADAWIAANPQRAPRPRGLARFLRNWFERAVERQRKEQRAKSAQ